GDVVDPSARETPFEEQRPRRLENGVAGAYGSLADEFRSVRVRHDRSCRDVMRVRAPGGLVAFVVLVGHDVLQLWAAWAGHPLSAVPDSCYLTPQSCGCRRVC